MATIRRLIKKLKKRLERIVSNVPKRKFFFQINTNLFRVNKRLVLIESFHGQNISDSSLEFAKEILRSYPGQYKIYFASENVKEHSAFIKSIGLDVKLTDVNKLSYTKILATAGTILTNASLPIYFIKREGQTYLQTWHGTPLKTLGKKMRMGIESLYIAQHSFLQADYLTQPNEFTKDIIMGDYNLERLYTGKVVMAGYPRNTIFLQPEKGRALRKKMGLEDKTLYVYMPTWRGTSNHSVVTTNYANRVQEIFKKLDKSLHEDQIFYVKFHPILRDAVKLDSYKHIKPFPNNVEPYEFISCVDALVTDYSSVFFDFSLTKKPVVLFLYDYDEYMHDRGINMDIRDLPFRQIYDTDEFCRCIGSNACMQDRYEDTEYFRTFFRYDSADVTKKLLHMVFTGDESGFEITDYAQNRQRRIKVFEPETVGNEYDFNTLAEVTDEDSVVLLYKKWFKGEVSQILHDSYNDSFDYVITTYTPPRTFLEEFFAFLGSRHFRKKIHLRDIQRTFPHLNVDPEFITDYGCVKPDCSVAAKDTVYAQIKGFSAAEGGNIRVAFDVPAGYALQEAVICSRNKNTILYTRPLLDAEKEQGSVEYDFTQPVESLKVFRGHRLTPGIIAVDGSGNKKLLLFTDGDKLKKVGRKLNPRNKYELFFSPVPMRYTLPADYFKYHLQRVVFSREEKQRAKLNNYNMTPTLTEMTAVPFIDFETTALKLKLVAPEAVMNEMSSGASLRKIRCGKNRCRLTLMAYGLNRDEVVSTFLDYRSTTEDIRVPLTFKTAQKRKGTLIKVSHTFDASQGLKEIFWDFRIGIHKLGTDGVLRVKNGSPRNILKLYLTNQQSFVDKDNIVFPYFGKGSILCFLYRRATQYDTLSVKFKELIALALYTAFRPLFARKKLRIIYEKFCQTAQDNSYYFFKYCMEALPEKEKKNIFYIIDKSAPDYQKIKQFDKHIVQFMSLKHMLYALAMNICISTDSTSHLYLWRTKPSLIRRKIKSRKNEYFLQHGVIALKCVHNIFGKNSTSPMKYFTTSSQAEHEIIVDEFGYKPEEVPITGLCRWDVLEDKRDDSDRFILLMPTWRMWLEEVSDELFMSSDYYRNYSQLMTDERLGRILEENNVNLILYLHPKFAEYTETFKDKISKRVKTVPFGEQSLNELIMKCSMLITDYSSVCWDAHYINKPVLFYQFDYEKYNIAHGSYINLETDLFGDRTTELSELIDFVEAYIRGGLKTKPEYEKKAYDYFMYHDHNNSKRTFDFIKSQGY